MDLILQEMSHVICYIYDILVTGAPEDEHDRNLDEVLRRLQEHDVRLKREKCSFFKDSRVFGTPYQQNGNTYHSGEDKSDSRCTRAEEHPGTQILFGTSELLREVHP